MDWPKKWEDAVKANFTQYDDDLIEGILACLDHAGALKEIPKPREFWVHEKYPEVYNSKYLASNSHRIEEFIHVREVLSDED